MWELSSYFTNFLVISPSYSTSQTRAYVGLNVMISLHALLLVMHMHIIDVHEKVGIVYRGNNLWSTGKPEA